MMIACARLLRGRDMSMNPLKPAIWEPRLNDGSYGGCNDDCSRAPFCGDGILQPEYEACDPLLATAIPANT